MHSGAPVHIQPCAGCNTQHVYRNTHTWTHTNTHRAHSVLFSILSVSRAAADTKHPFFPPILSLSPLCLSLSYAISSPLLLSPSVLLSFLFFISPACQLSSSMREAAIDAHALGPFLIASQSGGREREGDNKGRARGGWEGRRAQISPAGTNYMDEIWWKPYTIHMIDR